MKDAKFVAVLINTTKSAQTVAEVNEFMNDGHGLYWALYHVR